ncbi:helix-turn-helix domain-containing protein [Lichenicola sp.]|uniref:helix-turn-helix domain-containing protein n=1 Tax=Lichenicola sp. TaxID=2804529 RepID=UPI003B007F4E
MVSAKQWHDSLAVPALSGDTSAASGTRLVRFRGIDGRISQPALLENLLSIHLGGPKRVTRFQARHKLVRDVEAGSITIMPSAQPARWSTVGPIDFAHVTLAQNVLEQTALEDFDRDPVLLRLQDRVGVESPFIRDLFEALLADVTRPRAGSLYRESLIVVLAHELVKSHSNFESHAESLNASVDRPSVKGGLAGWQLQRVIELMRQRLSDDVMLGDLIAVTGLSRSHFFRAFRCSTRRTPHAFLTDLRVQQAAEELATTRRSVTEIATAVGMDPTQLAHAFRRRHGLSPVSYRRQRGCSVGITGAM